MTCQDTIGDGSHRMSEPIAPHHNTYQKTAHDDECFNGINVLLVECLCRNRTLNLFPETAQSSIVSLWRSRSIGADELQDPSQGKVKLSIRAMKRHRSSGLFLLRPWAWSHSTCWSGTPGQWVLRVGMKVPKSYCASSLFLPVTSHLGKSLQATPILSSVASYVSSQLDIISGGGERQLR
jgi:hypothetical protein